jgi:Uma2 family endonuclease
MTVVQRLNFAEYLNYARSTESLCELVDGELVVMSLGTGRHGAIAKFLEQLFDGESQRTGKAWTAQRFSVAVRSPRGGRWDTARIPDVVVLPIAQWQQLQDQEAVIDLHDPPPLLVVEVVSESTRSTDYRAKRSEYAVLNIAEYWIVDPLQAGVTVCRLVEGLYDAEEFRASSLVDSQVFSELEVTAEQVLSAGQEG